MFVFVFGLLPSAFIIEFHRVLKVYLESLKESSISYPFKARKLKLTLEIR